MPARLRAAVLLALLAVACTDQGTSPTRVVPGAVTLMPRFHAAFPAGVIRPISRVRITAAVAATGEVLGRTELQVDPALPDWEITFEVPIPPTPVPVLLLAELIHVSPDGPVVESSGRLGPITLTPGTNPVQTVPVFPGPLEYHTLTGIHITAAPERLLEGESATAAAEVTGGAAPRLFWSTADPAILTVDAEGAVTGIAPGRTHLRVHAGPHADSVLVEVGARPSRVVVAPAAASADRIGAELVFDAVVEDPRGAPLPLDVTWSVLAGDAVEHLGDGRFRVRAAGSATVQAALPGTTLTGTGVVTVGLRPAAVTVTPATGLLAARGATLTLSAVVADPGGTPIPDVPVSWATSDPSIASVSASGVVTAVSDGEVTITARAELNGAAAEGTARITVARVPADVTIVAGDGQSAPVGSMLPVAPAVRVLDAAGAAIAGVTVGFAVVAGGGSLADGTATTDADGVAAAGAWTLGTGTGLNLVRVTVAGLPPLELQADAHAGPPADLAVIAGAGQIGRPGQPLPQNPTVRVRDSFGNGVPGIDVAFEVSAGDGSVSPGTATTDADGYASTSWTLGDLGENRLAVSAAGFAAFFSADARPGAPALLTIVAGDGQSGLAGSTLPEAPSVRVTDEDGNPIAGVSVTFTAADGGSIAPDVATSGADGVATAGVWTLGPAAGTQSLTAATGELTAQFTATARVGAAARLEIHVGDGQSAVAGTAVTVPPAVRVTDALGNAVAGVAVSFAVSGGGGTVSGAEAVTDANGVATVGSWTLGGTAGANALTANAAGLSVTFAAQATAGTAALLELVAGDGQIAVTRQAVAVPPTVRVTDGGLNPVAGVTVSFAVTAGDGSVTPSSVITGADGTASTSWTLGSPGTHALSAAVEGLTAVTFTARAVPGAPAELVIHQGDGQSAGVGQPLPIPPAVRVLDGFGNPVPEVQVVFAVAAGGGTLTGAAALSDPDGVATVGGWTLGDAGENRLSASTAGTQPVSFVATAIAAADPCVLPVSLGTPQSATFADGQCLVDGVPTHAFTFSLATASPLGLALDPPLGFLVALERDGIPLFAGAPEGEGRALLAAPPGSYTLRVRPENPATRGTYTLSSLLGLPEPCAEMQAVVPLSIDLALTAASCPTADGLVHHRFGLRAAANSAHRITAIASGPMTIRAALGSPSVSSATETQPQMVLQPAADEHFLLEVVGAPGTTYTLHIDPVAPAHSLVIHEGNEQYAQTGHPLPVPPAVRVLDESGEPVPGIAVTFEVLSGGGEVIPNVVLADANGVARADTWRMGATPGPNTLRAYVGTTASAMFTADAVDAGAIEIVSGNGQIAEAGAALESPLVARLVDGAGNPLGGVDVTWAVTAGGGTAEVIQGTSDADGLVQAALTTGTIGGINRVAVHASPLEPAEFRSDAINGTLVLFEDDFDLENGGVAGGAVTSLRHWEVVEGSAALRGNGVDDAIPGSGLYVDVNGLLRTTRSFTVEPGNYLLVYRAAGQPTTGTRDEVEGRLGGATSAFLGFVNPSTSFFRRAGSIHFDEPGVVPIEIQTYSESGAGILIDGVRLTRQGPPAELRKVIGSHGDGQTGTAGQPLADPIVVALVDGNGDPFADHMLTFTASDGGLLSAFGSTPAPSLTIPSSNFGVGLVEWTLGPVAGTQTVTVSADGVPSITYTATAVAAEPLRWINTSGGSWHDPANWDAGRVPGAGDNVIIDLDGTYEVGISSPAAAAQVSVRPAGGTATLRVGAVLTVAGIDVDAHGRVRVASSISGSSGAVVENRGTLQFEGGTITAQVVNHGVMNVPPGTATMLGLINESTGVISLNGNNGDAVLNLSNALQNHGTIEMSGTSWNGHVSAGGGIDNEPGGVIRSLGSHNHQLIGAVRNRGTLDVTRGMWIQNVGHTFESLDGDVIVADGAVFRINGGAIELNGGAPFTGVGGVQLHGAVTVQIDDDVVFEATGPSWSMPGTATFTGSGTFTNRSTLPITHDVFHLPVLNEGTITIGGSARADFHAGFTNAQTGTLVLSGSNGSAAVGVNGELANHGLIELGGTSWTGVITASSLVNYATGVVATAGSAAGHTFDAAIANYGRFAIDQTATINNASRTLGAEGGTFEVAAGRVLNIQNGTVAINAASVFTGAGTLALHGNVTVAVNGDYAFAADGLTWSLPGSVDFTATGTLTNRSTLLPSHDRFHAPFVNEGAILLTGSTSVEFLDGFTNAADGVLTLDGNNGNANVTVPGTLTNDGAIVMTGSSWIGVIQAAELVNRAGGVITTAGSAAGHTFNASITNHGLFSIGQSATVTNTSRTLDALAGTFDVAPGRTLTINGGTIALTDASVFSGTGTLALAGSVMVNAATDYIFPADGLVWNLNGSVDFHAAGTLTNRATLRLTHDRFHAPFINEGLVLLEGSDAGTFNSGFHNATGGVLRLNGNNGQATIHVTGTLENDGAVELTGTSWVGVINAGTLLNNAAGVITTSGSAAGHTFNAVVVNDGLFDIDQSATVPNASRTLQARAGTFDIAAGRTFSVSNGIVALTDASVFSGTGTLALTGTVDVQVDGDYEFAADGIAWSMSGNVDFTSTGTFTNRTTLQPSHDRFHSPFVNQGAIVIDGSSSVDFAAGIVNGADGTLILNGNNGQATVHVTGTLENLGVTELTGTSWVGVINADALINRESGRIFAHGTAAGHTLNTVLSNEGEIDVERSLSLSNVGRTYQALDGTVTVAAGNSFTVNGGTVQLTPASVFAGAGSLNLSGTITVHADGDYVVQGLVWNMSGTVDVTGTGSITNRTLMRPTHDRFHTPFVNEGTIEIPGSGLGEFLNDLTIADGGTLTLNGNNGSASLTVGGTLTNEGLLELTGTSWQGIVNAPVLYNGAAGDIVISGTSNDHQLNAALTNDGSITLQRSVTLARASAQHANAGTITLATGNLTVSQSGTAPSFGNTGSIEIGSGRTFVIGGGAFTNDGTGVIGGSGTIRTDNGATFFNDATLRPGGSAVGTLTVQGSVGFGGGSVLEVQIDGPGTGQFDVLNVTATALVDGTLALERDADYTPTLGTAFDVVTAGTVSGDFTGTTGSAVNGSLFLGVSMQPTAVRIIATAVVN